MKDRANGLVGWLICPTLCDLAGLSQPEHLAGHSLVSLLENPNADGKGFAVSQFPNPALLNGCQLLSAGMKHFLVL